MTSQMDKLIKPVFTLDLGFKVLPGLVTIGKYDGSHPCLTVVTLADKIVIHSPHRRSALSVGRLLYSESNKEIATLNFNQTITALTTGLLVPNEERDILVVGSATHLLAYHVHDNKDLFYIECKDGIRVVFIEKFGNQKKPVVFVGGNSSVHGYDFEGNEVFWTPVGDCVTAITLLDYNKDGTKELVVSSEDFTIRVLKADQTITEITETETVTGLIALDESRFAYSVSNGTVGIYEQDLRLWRVKSKHFAVSMTSYDLLGTGAPQLVTGWSNGKLDCRSTMTGEVLFKSVMDGGFAGIVEGDYRSIGKSDLICVSTEGEVRGYSTTKTLSVPAGVSLEQDVVRDLLSQKQALELELKHYENNSKYNEELETPDVTINGVIPASTRLQIVIDTKDSKTDSCVEVFISTNNDTIIKAIIVFSEGIFSGETHVIHPPLSKLKTCVSVPLRPNKDTPLDIHLKVLVGYPNSAQYHVFELSRQLPRFSMYSLQKQEIETDTSHSVTFKINERLQRICMWINQNFLLARDLEYESGSELKLQFRCLRDDTILTMKFHIAGNVTFFAVNMGLVADLVQSLAGFLNLQSLESRASFPTYEKALVENMEKLESIQDSRIQLNSDNADKMQRIRNYLLLAENCRINNEFEEMSEHYTELNFLNKELMKGYNVTFSNYTGGIETMKEINSIIQKASRLRVGSHAAQVIICCRNAIKANNVEGLVTILKTGSL